MGADGCGAVVSGPDVRPNLNAMRVIIDGRPVNEADARVSVFDWAVMRGFGVFEVIRSYGVAPFRLGPHLDRLERSAAALAVGLPGRDDLISWVTAAAENGEGQVRIVVTGGGRDPLFDAPSQTIIMWEPVPDIPSPLRVMPLEAPWHPGTADGPLSGIKWLSYAPNMASADMARRAGFHDALLYSRDGFILEGPTFGIAWLIGDVIETPGLDLGILASITRSVLFEIGEHLGIEVREVSAPLERLLAADEVVGLSTVKEVIPIGVIGDRKVRTGPVAERLRAEFLSIVADETGPPA